MHSRKLFKLLAVLIFWAAVWHLLSCVVASKLLLPSPYETVKAFSELICTYELWSAVAFTFLRIVSGFFSALIFGVILAVFSSVCSFVKMMLTPFMTALKSVPVASFVILAILWIGSENLSAFISFVMVLPIVYINVLTGIDETPKEMIEMSRVYKMNPLKKAMYVYMPGVIPHFKAASKVSLGLCWKAGVASELIGLPTGSIGEQFYLSKAYYLTTDLFAWTFVVIFISIIFEKIYMICLERLIKIYERI